MGFMLEYVSTFLMLRGLMFSILFVMLSHFKWWSYIKLIGRFRSTFGVRQMYDWLLLSINITCSLSKYNTEGDLTPHTLFQALLWLSLNTCLTKILQISSLSSYWLSKNDFCINIHLISICLNYYRFQIII